VTGDRWGWGRTGYWLLVTGHVLLAAACTVTPLTNKISVGEEAFVIGVGEGPDSLTDLFAAPAGNGAFARLTFNRAEEHLPRLAPDGLRVAYLRRARGQSSWTLVILDLLSNAEQTSAVPLESGPTGGLGWSLDGTQVVLRTGEGRYYSMNATGSGKARLVPIASGLVVQADSLTRELLGPAREGLVRACGGELCVAVGDSLTPLGAGVSGAIRWGPDSVGYFSNGRFEVRPLAGGVPRRPGWKEVPGQLREITYAAPTPVR